MLRASTFSFCLLTWLCTGPAQATDYVVHWNPVMAPQGPLDLISDCLGDDICNAALSTLMVSVGMPPLPPGSTYVVNALDYENDGSEVFRGHWSPQAGETICSAKVKVISGNGPAEMAVAIRIDGPLSFYAYVKREPFTKFAGRNWVDTLVYVNTVPQAAFNPSQCQPDGDFYREKY
ncbi:hypothetical protein FJ986_06675 [Mesorhizobium sp. B1-1-1]|uniref:hypothetical protein n=1 Tax=Mesorhizobium sp. B1-1-1 TaxID=2589983 RepID=UPI00112BCEC2|nr:hypothetical protein [Mesorhizobium sp. B1-1-1]TPN69023.1 hypothetical protein FJ986_06675 [Mesorhizobium sp. B1-1-1]